MWKFDSFLSKYSLIHKPPRIFLNKDGSVLTWNKYMEEIEGYTAKEIVGKKFNYFFSSTEFANDSFDTLLEVAVRKKKVKYSGLLFLKDGSTRRGAVILEPIYDEKHSLIGFDMGVQSKQKINNVYDAIKIFAKL